MPQATVYIVSDDFDTTEKLKSYCESNGISYNSFHTQQWVEGMNESDFRSQLTGNLPDLAAGTNGAGNVVPFPTSKHKEQKVSTINELESKAIEMAISQYKGNLTEAAKALGIGRATLYRKVKLYHIDPTSARRRRAA